MMPQQPANPQVRPQPTPNSSHIPCKQQARLDDNGEPAGVPAAKKVKSTNKIGQKKKVPLKTLAQPEKKNSATSVSAAPAPAKKKLSVKIGVLASDPGDSDEDNTNSQLEEPVIVDSSDEVEVIEEPAEDDEAQLGVYPSLLSNKIVSF